MSIARLALSDILTSSGRFIALFGPGLDDVYLDESYTELDFSSAFCRTLASQGFDQILLYSAHQQVIRFPENEPLSFITQQDTSTNEYDDSIRSPSMRWLSDGPLQSRFILPQQLLAPSSRQSVSGMGDSHAVRLLDTLMKDNQHRTAVVVLQAETTLRFHEDQRTLAALMGSWKNLPSDNGNLCFFAFSAPTQNALDDISGRIPVPELRSLILSQKNLFYVGSPAQDEIDRLVARFEEIHPNVSLSTNEKNRLLSILSAEGQPLRQWINWFQSVNRLSLRFIREQGWLSSSLDPRPALERLNNLTGLDDIRLRLDEWASWLNIQNRKKTTRKHAPLLHMVFMGNPGTGKTTVARLLGEMLQDMGCLKRGHCVEVKASDLIAEHVGGTAQKTRGMIEQAKDGILFIDEAYTLAESSRGGFGQEAIDTLLPYLEDRRENLMVIVAGYTDKMTFFLDSNPGLSRRFPLENRLIFPDYSPHELIQILEGFLIERDLQLSSEITEEELSPILASLDGNGGGMRNLADALERRWSNRIVKENLPINSPLIWRDFPESLVSHKSRSHARVEEFLHDFDGLIGLENIRSWMTNEMNLVNFDLNRKKVLTLPSGEGRHLVFSGNPGTGKTTVARLLGNMYHRLGLLKTGHVVEVSRADLVAGYVGQTAQKTLLKIKEAFGGILFIDEAYALLRSSDDIFGQEALDTLVKAMEDYRHKVIVIAAGYPLEIRHFLAANPGLSSRFSKEIEFPDFSISQLIEIFLLLAKKDQILVPDDLLPELSNLLSRLQIEQRHQFGNARSVRKLFMDMKSSLANRLADSPSIKVSFTLEDIHVFLKKKT